MDQNSLVFYEISARYIQTFENGGPEAVMVRQIKLFLKHGRAYSVDKNRSGLAIQDESYNFEIQGLLRDTNHCGWASSKFVAFQRWVKPSPLMSA